MATDLLTEPRVTDDAVSPIYAENGIGHGVTTRDPTRITWQHISRFLAGDVRHYLIGGRKPFLRQIGEMIKLSLAYETSKIVGTRLQGLGTFRHSCRYPQSAV